MHPVPRVPFTAALGVTRRVDMMSLVTFEGGQLVRHRVLAAQTVYIRRTSMPAAAAAPGEPSRAGEDRTLAQGTGGWALRDGTEAAR